MHALTLNLTFARRDGLSALACALQCSVFHLCRVFREYYGLTIHQYRSQLRLRKSLEWFGESWDDILTTAIALVTQDTVISRARFTGCLASSPQSFGRCQSDVDWRDRVIHSQGAAVIASKAKTRFKGFAMTEPP